MQAHFDTSHHKPLYSARSYFLVDGLIEVFESSHHIYHLSHRIFGKNKALEIKIETKI